MFKIRVFAAFCALTLATSCQKTDVETPIGPSELKYDRTEYEKNLIDASITGSYTVINGVLHFRNFNAFSETQERFQTLSELEKRRIFSEIGFSSYSNEFALVSERINNVTSKEEYDKILSNNQDIIEIGADGSLRSKVERSFVHDFTNRKGLVYIGKVLYQFNKEYQKIAFDGEASGFNSDVESEQLLVIKRKVVSIRNARNCLNFYKAVEQNGDRRATASTSVTPVSFITGYQGSNPIYRVQWALRLQGYPEKKNFFGNWVSYNTVNNLKSGFGFTVFPLNSSDPYGTRSMVASTDLSNEGSSIFKDFWLVYDGITNPVTFVNEHSYYLDDSYQGPYQPNTYETRGVSTFTYGCP